MASKSEISGSENRISKEHLPDIGVCILSAGLAKRLEPISSVIAKPAFPLCGGPPIAELWVRKFINSGISNIAMNLHKVPDSIQSYFGDGSRFLAKINYVYENEPSGTLGGAIKMVKLFNSNGFFPKRVFIPSGDIVSGIQNAHLNKMYTEHINRCAVFSMLLAPIPLDRRKDFGTTILEGYEKENLVPGGTFARIKDFVEKDPNSPSVENNASLYLIETDFLLSLEQYLSEAKKGLDKPCYDFGAHVLMGLIGRVPHLEWLAKYRNDLYGYEPNVLWYDVGNKRDYIEVNKAALNGEIDLELPYTKYPWGWLGNDVNIDFNSINVKPPVVIGNNCVIYPETTIGPNAVIGDGWVIHRGATIKNSILWPCYDFRSQSAMKDRSTISFREVRDKKAIENAIVAGGVISENIQDATVVILPNGRLDIRSIDWIPKGPRI